MLSFAIGLGSGALHVSAGPSIGSFSWDSSTTTPAASSASPYPTVTRTHKKMRGCLVLDSGDVNYYLDPTDWSLKEDGTASDLTGPDGQVMVEIPAFYTRRTKVGTVTTWEISDQPVSGFSLHPAFVKDGATVTHRYIGAYDACVYDVTDSTYKSGLNWDNNSTAGILVDSTAGTGDVLSSVSGVYPIVGLTRGEFRLLGRNRGAGWRQLDYTLWCAVNLLYLVEFQTFYSQDELGSGNTNSSYLAASGTQSDSPHTVAGAGDSWASGSTDGSQPSSGARPGTAYMKFRGIENFFGNAWNFVDGIITNWNGNVGRIDVSNDGPNWSDSSITYYTQIASDYDTSGNDWITDFTDVDDYFVPNESTSGSSSTYITDRNFPSASFPRVTQVGGSAAIGSGQSGMFCMWTATTTSGRGKDLGARLSR